jgi:hypothetical protein
MECGWILGSKSLVGTWMEMDRFGMQWEYVYEPIPHAVKIHYASPVFMCLKKRSQLLWGYMWDVR